MIKSNSLKAAMKRSSLYVLALMMALSVIPTNVVLAQGVPLENYYRENNITFFGEDKVGSCGPGGENAPTGGGTAVGGEVTGDKGKAVYDYFIAKGLRPWMAAGILGNLVAESGLNSGIENGIGAYGLAQWLGSRKAGLQEFARNQGKPVDDFGMQLDYIWFEFENDEKSAGDAIKATTSLADAGQVDGAVRVVMEKYERPSAAEQRDSFQKRLDAAIKGLEAHGNGAPSSGLPLDSGAPSAPGGGTGGPTASGNCAVGGNFTGIPGQTEPLGDGYTLADNTDYSGTPCAPGTTETQVYVHPTRGFSVRLCNAAGFVVASIISEAVLAMVNAAAASGVTLKGGAFRSYEQQIQTRRNNGCPADPTAPSSSCRVPTAPPGRSQHERGLALDFSSSGTIRRGSPEFNWLSSNAATYGLINWEVEPWHWSTSGN